MSLDVHEYHIDIPCAPNREYPGGDSGGLERATQQASIGSEDFVPSVPPHLRHERHMPTEAELQVVKPRGNTCASRGDGERPLRLE